MATTQLEEKPRIITLRNSRRNEIIAILFLALGLLLSLCLVSAAFFPNDPSWNSVGANETRNWAGAIGANVAAALFQAMVSLPLGAPAMFARRGGAFDIENYAHFYPCLNRNDGSRRLALLSFTTPSAV